MRDVSTVNERIQSIINEYYNGNVSEFERMSQIKPYTVKNIVGGRQTKPSFDVLESIVRNNVQLSERWILTGEGKMEKQSSEIVSEGNLNLDISMDAKDVAIQALAEKVQRLESENAELRRKLGIEESASA